MTDMRTEALDDHQRVLRARASAERDHTPRSVAAPLSAVYGPLTTDLDDLPTREGMRAPHWARTRGAWA